MSPQTISVADPISRAVDDLDQDGEHVRVSVPDELPEVYVDPALLERILVNVLTNALGYSPAGQPPLIAASEHSGQVQIRVMQTAGRRVPTGLST